MKSNLSAFYYIKNNKKEVAIRLVSLTMAFLVIYIVAVLLFAIAEGTKIFAEQSKHVVFMVFSEDTRGFDINKYTDMNEAKNANEKSYKDIAEKLNDQEGIKKAYATKGILVSYRTQLGGLSMDIPLIDKDEIPNYIKETNTKLVEGDMPKNEGEVLLEKKILKNNGLKLGDYLYEDHRGGYKISGVVESEYFISVGIPSETFDGDFITCLIDDNVTDMNNILKKIGISPDEDKDKVIDYKYAEKKYVEEINKTVDDVIVVMIYVIMVFISVALVVAYISFMRNRTSEYCLYASIGFSRREIYIMIMKEILIIFTFGIIIGALSSFVIIYIMQNTIMASNGTVICMMYPDVILKIVMSFIFVIGLLQMPILAILNKIKTIDMIED